MDSSEGGTPSGVAPPCMSVNVSSCYELSVTEVSTADANPSSSQSSLAADQQPPSAGWGSGPDPVGGVTLRLRLRLRLLSNKSYI